MTSGPNYIYKFYYPVNYNPHFPKMVGANQGFKFKFGFDASPVITVLLC